MLLGPAVSLALFAGVGTAQARYFLGAGIGVPGVVVEPPLIAAPVPVIVAPPPQAYAGPEGPTPTGYVWLPGAYGWEWRGGHWH